MLGITMDFSPRFLRRYLNLSEQIESAINDYVDDVRSGEFPSESEQY
jgi:3-methyl-2-oxobutanoate hydroxymethyltransferase